MKRAAAIAEIRARRALLAVTGKRHRRRGPIPRQLQPDAIRLSYLSALLRLLARARALVHERLLPIVERQVAQRADGRLDDAKDISDELDKIAAEWFAEFPNEQLARLAEDFARRTSSFQRGELAKQFKSAIGIDVVKTEPWLEPAIRDFSQENVALIKSVPKRYFAELETTIQSGMREGLRWEELSADIEERYGVAESSAKLIARDQVGKFMGELNQTRQEELGVTHYVWRTARDNRVRDSHAALEGKRIAWDDPPAVGRPGEDINCRCAGEPDLEQFIEEAAA